MSTFNIIFFGDVVGRAGRGALAKHLPAVRNQYEPEFIIVNGENAAAGFGITPSICEEFFSLGVDVITTGNHVWDQKEIFSFANHNNRVLRPLNYPPSTVGTGQGIYESKSGLKIGVANLMARLFMDPLDDPFAHARELIESRLLKNQCNAFIVDFHGEATSEKMSMGHFLDGHVTAVLGTHTHVPTADHRILKHGTGYMSDVGMCGDYDSVVGMDKEIAMSRFITKMPNRLRTADGDGTLCGVAISVSRETGLAVKLTPIRRGANLETI
ncbi:MAG: metallophosphoesterase [Alphaproteobacteria bacterium 43-37]|nr:MAG: metallophosphoesterase [Alphaproteobacteria bacterium 43-37]